MPTLKQLKEALVLADMKGMDEQADKLAWAAKYEIDRRANDPMYKAEGAQMVDPDVPGYVSDEIPWMAKREEEPNVLERGADFVGGLVEAPITMATATAGQAVGLGNMIHEGVKAYFAGAQQGRGIEAVQDYFTADVGRRTEEAFQRGAEAATYQPRTETGQAIIEYTGEAMNSLPPVLAPSFAQAAVMGQAARGVAPIARARVVDPSIEAARETAQRARAYTRDTVIPTMQQARELLKKPKPEPSGSVGAMKLDLPELTQAKADELLDPIPLTKGELTRDFEDLRFERETRKLPQGAKIREADIIRNKKVANNLDLAIDETGARLVTIGEKGDLIDQALQNMMNVRNKEINAAYDKARQAGEMSEPVELSGLIDYLNEPLIRAKMINEGVLRTTKSALLKTGAAREVDAIGPNNEPIKLLAPNTISLNEGEQIRRNIGESVTMARGDRREGKILKAVYDEDTEGHGGDFYKRARYLRRRYGQDFENNALVNKLTKKTDSGERLIAIESMTDLILSPSSSLASVDRLKKLRTLLLKDEQGRQAWKEIQGDLLERIKEQTFRTSNYDENRNPIPSYAGLNKIITQMDKSGKLDLILGKKGGQQMRTLRDIVQHIYTQPPGVVNHSNTATVLAALLDGVLLGSGVPAPFASTFKIARDKIKDRALQKKIDEHLKGIK